MLIAQARVLYDLSAFALRERCKQHGLRCTLATTKSDMRRRIEKFATQAVVYEGWTLRQLCNEIRRRGLDA